MKRNIFSLVAWWLATALILLTGIACYPKWEQANTKVTISWDVSGYYLYLAAAILHKDLRQLAFFPKIEEKHHPGPGMGQAFKHPESGNFVMKYSMGQALQYLAWFGSPTCSHSPWVMKRTDFPNPNKWPSAWAVCL
jgi:hypothetical protein